MDVDSIPLSKLGEREIKPILDDEARQALTERTSTTRTTRAGKLHAAELSRLPCSAFELFDDARSRRIENRSALGSGCAFQVAELA